MSAKDQEHMDAEPEPERRASSSSSASPFKDHEAAVDQSTSVHGTNSLAKKNRISAVRDADASSAREGQQPGVSRIEALYRVFPRNSPVVWLVYASLAAVSISFSPDQSTTAAYQLYATRTLGNHAKLFGVIGTVEAIINAVSKPFIAKICDIFSRQTAYLLVAIFYTIGFVVAASAVTPGAFAVGRIITEVGQAGFDLVTDIVVADLSPLEWRGVATALTSAPYIVLPWVGNLIQARLNRPDRPEGWRWGYGMFAIMAPVCVAPIILVLTFADRKARKAGELSFASSRLEMQRAQEQQTVQVRRDPLKERFAQLIELCRQMDLVGLFLLALSFALILVPFSIYKDADKQWRNPSIIAMFVCGGIILGMFVAWEVLLASHPVMNKRVWYNRTFLLAVTIDIFYFMGGNLRSTYYGTFVLVGTNLSTTNWGYVVNALSTAGLSLFGLLAGLYLRFFHRYKLLQIGGLVIRIVAMGLYLYGRNGNLTTMVVAWSQILNSLGGACSVVGTRVASQASVPHQDLASIIAQLGLWTRLGGAIGTAISAGIWTGTLPDELQKINLTAAQRNRIYASPTTVKTTYAWNTPLRNQINAAFSNTMKPILITSLVLAFIPLAAGAVMPNYYLGKTQNVVDGTDNSGRVIESADENPNADINKKKSIFARFAWGKK
ncbi:related to Siderophore iron transporter 3 [Sporisorium reilianum f. sp. reilianum]|uniref:Related to Siderophore iron transporter 3 n=1 Tax=Sporisorium reilianum f. sp. reilianum TaxID=72559 RepID=A0A2N8UB11_9BASI|nr:related to Siderophore iron transporter 3 [Sporisorium reilianum f. sp. reilianum]